SDNPPGSLGNIRVGSVGNGLVDYVEIEGIWRRTSTVMVQDSFAAAGDIIGNFGVPTAIFAGNPSFFEISREFQVLMFAAHFTSYNRDAVDPHDPISAMMLTRLVNCSDYTRDFLKNGALTPWLGIATISRYRFTPTTPTVHRIVNVSAFSSVLCQ